MQVNNTVVFAAFNQFAATVNGATRILREALVAAGVTTVEDAAPLVLEWAATTYDVALVEGQRKAKGRMVLSKESAGYHAAHKAAQRLMDALKGDANAEITKSEMSEEEAEEMEIPAEILAAAAALAALCNEYDLTKAAMKKMAAKSVAQAFAAL